MKSTFDSTQYPNPYFIPKMKGIQDTWKTYLDVVPFGKFPLSTNKDGYFEDQFMYMSSALAADYTAASDTTVDVTAGHGVRFRIGDVIQFANVNVTYAITGVLTDTLTIGSAAHYGTKANATNGDVVTIVSRAELSGADALLAARDMTAQPVERICHTSLIKQTIFISSDAMTDATKYGVSKEARIAMEDLKGMKSAIRILAIMSMMGYYKTSESSTVRGYMDGLLPTFKTANSLSGGSLSATNIIKAFYTHQGAGAERCSHVLCSPDMHGETVAAFRAQNNAPPGSPIGMYFPFADTVFGRVEIISDPRIRSSKTMLFSDMSLIEMGNKQGMAFKYEELGKTGDAYKALIYGRYGQMIYGRDTHQAYVTFS